MLYKSAVRTLYDDFLMIDHYIKVVVMRCEESNDVSYYISLICGIALLFNGLQQELGHIINNWKMTYGDKKPDKFMEDDFLKVCDLLHDMA